MLLLGAALGHEPLFLLLGEFPCTLARTYTVYKCVQCTHLYKIHIHTHILLICSLNSATYYSYNCSDFIVADLALSLRIIFTETSNNIHYAESYIPIGIFCLTVLGKNLMYFAYQKAKLANAKENPLISKCVLRGKAWQID